MNFQTSRCNIRRFKEDDIRSFMLYRNDLQWMIYQGFKDKTYNEYKEILLSVRNIDDGTQLAIACRDTDALIGDIYLQLEGDICYIGYTITPKKTRQGYAFEVVSAAISNLAKQGVKTIKAGVLPQNTASVNLLKKLSFVYECCDDGDDIYTLNVKEHLKRNKL